MKYFFALLVSCLSQVCIAEPELLGKWKSEPLKTMEFNVTYANMSDQSKEFLSQMMGHMTIEFGERSFHMVIPDLQISISGKVHEIVGTNELSDYKVVFANDKSIAITTYDKTIKKNTITVYNFVDPDLIWVYVSGFDAGLPDMHFREYFSRIK